MTIEVFGPGCYRCVQTLQVLRRVLDELGKKPGRDVVIHKVEDLRAIAERRVLTPAVAIDGRLVCQGKIPTVDEAKRWFTGGAA